ncbi:MAG: hypothetical protein WAO83_07135 [Fuerstiella sp.]
MKWILATQEMARTGAQIAINLTTLNGWLPYLSTLRSIRAEANTPLASAGTESP